MRTKVRDDIFLTELRPSDKAAMLEHLSERSEIHEHTLRIPYPYTKADADKFLRYVAGQTASCGRPLTFAIRDENDFMIGICGFDDLVLGKSHKAEIGYWVAKPYWGQGIATAVVAAMTRMASDELHLAKVTAHVFAHNAASAQVLEKNGFELEGYLKKQFLKEGKFIDAKAYGLLLPR